MKELTIEQKAQRYDEAIKRAKSKIKNDKDHVLYKDDVIEIFPELSESEESKDERIRKGIIRNLEFLMDRAEGFVKNELKERIAWLEKQGEQKQELLTKEKALKNSPFVEQKPADKLKFKVGDFLVSDYCMGKVVELTNDAYLLDTEQGIPFSCEHNAHIWTIQDAKDGDVLCGYPEADYPWIGIFHKLNTEGTFSSYCFLRAGQHGKFCPPSGENVFGKRNVDNHKSKGIVPATQKQRDTLMKAMADAGYTFDFEKKELKKVEQKPKFRVGDTIKCKYDDRQFTIKSVDLDKGIYTYTQEGCGNDIDYADEEFELVEQDPTNSQFTSEQAGVLDKHIDKFLEQNIEPKFHEGDWLVHKDMAGEICCITQIHTPHYYLTDNNSFIRFGEEDNYHPWTIQDAKAGDVLACNEEILLFKSYSVQGRISLYCWYNGQTNNFHSKEVVDALMTTRNKICPATKEQRDLLFQKIKEAGYEWDTDKKELKKINSPILSNSSNIRKNMLAEWSEEDEYYYSIIQYILNNECVGKTDKENAISWLKSLKNRIHSQPKQEWSEEDETVLNNLIYALANDRIGNNRDEYVGWLKSLRPQNRWKPSELQIEALESATENCAYSEYQDCLKELIGQLKKLREE